MTGEEAPNARLTESRERRSEFVETRERAFPLLALIQLVTFWAALAACVDGPRLFELALDGLNTPWLSLSVAAGAILTGTLLGALVGVGQLRYGRGILVGSLIGALYGGTLAAIYAAPAHLYRWVFAAAVLLLSTIAFRIRSA